MRFFRGINDNFEIKPAGQFETINVDLSQKEHLHQSQLTETPRDPDSNNVPLTAPQWLHTQKQDTACRRNHGEFT